MLSPRPPEPWGLGTSARQRWELREEREGRLLWGGWRSYRGSDAILGGAQLPETGLDLRSGERRAELYPLPRHRRALLPSPAPHSSVGPNPSSAPFAMRPCLGFSTCHRVVRAAASCCHGDDASCIPACDPQVDRASAPGPALRSLPSLPPSLPHLILPSLASHFFVSVPEFLLILSLSSSPCHCPLSLSPSTLAWIPPGSSRASLSPLLLTSEPFLSFTLPLLWSATSLAPSPSASEGLRLCPPPQASGSLSKNWGE